MKQHDCNVSEIFMWIDSTIVFQYIRKNDKKPSDFRVNRVAEALESREMDQGNRVDAVKSPADLGTLGIS